jgi:AcrR family transcriptional regulator
LTKTSYHHGSLKNTILDEVLELLNYKSFDEISFRSISRNIGVVSSAPYNHFKDKKHLIKEVILLGEKKLFNAILLEKKKSKVLTDQLRLIAKAYLNFAAEEKALFNLMFSKNNKELLHLCEKIMLQFELVIIEKFRKGKRFKLTAKGSAITAWSMIHGVAITLNNSNKENLESLWHIELEDILGQMSAIWGKGVSEK